VGSFSLEILDTLEIRPGTPPEQVRADLAELEAIWREKLADLPRY
jgi:hypothetical protein